MNNSYSDTAIYLMVAVTVYAVADKILQPMNLSPLVHTYVVIGIAVGMSYLWDRHRRFHR